MVLDENVSGDIFIRDLLEGLEGIEVKNLKTKNYKKILRNYKCAIHKYNKTDKLEDIQGLLTNSKCLAVLVVSTAIPDNLLRMGIPVKITLDMAKYIGTPEFKEEMRAIYDFVRSAPEIAVREIKLTEPPHRLKSSALALSLFSAANVYYQYTRSCFSEMEQQIERIRVKKVIEDWVRESERLYENYDLTDAIIRVVVRYFDIDMEYVMADIDQIDGNAVEAIEDGNAIVYDSKYYYISESLFRKACGEILDVASFVDIKRDLRNAGALCCNNIENVNFTVKKVFVNVYGATCRGRFLKFRKEFLTTREGLGLEERRCMKDDEKNECWECS